MIVSGEGKDMEQVWSMYDGEQRIWIVLEACIAARLYLYVCILWDSLWPVLTSVLCFPWCSPPTLALSCSVILTAITCLSAPGGTRIDDGDKTKMTNHCVFSAKEDHETIRNYAQVECGSARGRAVCWDWGTWAEMEGEQSPAVRDNS